MEFLLCLHTQEVTRCSCAPLSKHPGNHGEGDMEEDVLVACRRSGSRVYRFVSRTENFTINQSEKHG